MLFIGVAGKRDARVTPDKGVAHRICVFLLRPECDRAAHDGQAEALNVFASPFLSSLYREIIDQAAEYRLPAIYQWKEHTEAGGLMSYGPSLPAMWEQSATIVVKVLKSAKPSDMPVEQPTKVELVVNLKTARP